MSQARTCIRVQFPWPPDWWLPCSTGGASSSQSQSIQYKSKVLIHSMSRERGLPGPLIKQEGAPNRKARKTV